MTMLQPGPRNKVKFPAESKIFLFLMASIIALRPTQYPIQCLRGLYVISGFCHGVNEFCTVLGFHTAKNGSFIHDILGQPIGPTFKDSVLLGPGGWD
jgi:hypothetical protein